MLIVLLICFKQDSRWGWNAFTRLRGASTRERTFIRIKWAYYWLDAITKELRSGAEAFIFFAT